MAFIIYFTWHHCTEETTFSSQNLCQHGSRWCSASSGVRLPGGYWWDYLGLGPVGWEVSSRVAHSQFFYFWVPIYISCHLSPGVNLRYVAFILLPRSLWIITCKVCLMLHNCAIRCSEITIKIIVTLLKLLEIRDFCGKKTTLGFRIDDIWFKLELQSGNNQFRVEIGDFFVPWDLEIWRMTLKNDRHLS